jgi:hypothetical protein
MRILNGRPTSACFKAPKLATIFCQRERERERMVVVGRVPGVTALPSGEAEWPEKGGGGVALF